LVFLTCIVRNRLTKDCGGRGNDVSISLIKHLASHSHTYFNNSLNFLNYFIQHCFVCRLTDFNVSGDAKIELRTVATWQSDTLTTRLDLMHNFFIVSTTVFVRLLCKFVSKR